MSLHQFNKESNACTALVPVAGCSAFVFAKCFRFFFTLKDAKSKFPSVSGRSCRSGIAFLLTALTHQRASQRSVDYAIPASRIALVSSGEFIGMVTDDPGDRYCKKIPIVRNITHEEIQNNYIQIKEEVGNLVSDEIKKLEVEISKQNEENDGKREGV